MSSTIDVNVLASFSPIDGLKKENRHALANKTEVREAADGEYLFTEGDAKKRAVYVLSGAVELLEASVCKETVVGGTPAARNPLSPVLPRLQSARAQGKVEYISIDSDLLDVMLTWDQTGQYEVSELRTQGRQSDDWMTILLQTKALQKIPPANIQAIFMRLQQVNYRDGDVVIKQGDEGDYFYVITRGQCSVTRETPLNKDGIKLAELGIGDTFGEEALISEAKRNATVTMTSDGSAVRLPQDMIRIARKQLVVRDGWASGFFHPFLDVSLLQELVEGIQALDYEFVPLDRRVR